MITDVTTTDVVWFSLFGIPLLHHMGEISFIEQFLNHHPNYDTFIEIGTYRGALSTFFGLHAARFGGKCLTFDNSHNKNNIFKRFLRILPIKSYIMDIFTPQAEKLVAEAFKNGRVLLYCDGGNKKLEFRKYAPYLKLGDAIMVHDNPNEIRFEDIADVCDSCGLERVYEEELKELKSRQMCFIRR